MKHLGDITKLDGHKLPLVDIVTGGSPCQDLSVAGKRAGLAGERSGLFMEQIRIIKEMRNESIKQLRLRGAAFDIRYIQPRYMVWENVPGAFSSNKGEDFRAVLEETAKVCDKDTIIPRPENGKWSPSGCILGNGWSIAWRVHDAQFWGVPQRRKRIALVADFGGETAPEILFERKGVSGDSEQGEQTRQEVTTSVGAGTNPSSYTLKVRGGREIDSKGHKAGKGPLVQTELSGTLGVSQDQTLIQTLNGAEQHAVAYDGCNITCPTNASNPQDGDPCHTLHEDSRNYVVIENHPADSRVQIKEDGVVQTLSSRMGTGGGNVPMVMESSAWDGSQVSPTLTANNAGGGKRMPDKDNFNAVIQGINGDIAGTLDASYYKGCGERQGVEREVVYGIDRASFNQGQNAQYDFSVTEEQAQTLVSRGPGGGTEQTVGALCARDYKGVGNQYVNEGKLIVQSYRNTWQR